MKNLEDIHIRINTYKIKIDGLVQGVGFRPFIYNLAISFNLNGKVENTNDGVEIEINATSAILKQFITEIKLKAPQASNIYSIEYWATTDKVFDSFDIKQSKAISNRVTEISPDIAVCDDCIKDMRFQKHRINYPFINCTNCGPRFTIIKQLPYDRIKTTMNEFPMCEICQAEYSNITDRRFHAQPVACNSCGPKYYTDLNDDEKIDDIIKKVSAVISKNGTFALKGLGGYHLGCNAFSEEAVNKLREIKKRDGKPFAIMFRNIEKLQEYTHINSTETELILSWRRPILLLEINNHSIFPIGISVGLSKIGVMLPYMPFHYLLFDKIETDAIVLTSGNISKEPIIIDSSKAVEVFNGKVDLIVHYNRDIYNRTDDSVIQSIDNSSVIIRRSRSFAPAPIRFNLDFEGIFAAGAELENVFAIGKSNQVILSQHIGDLQNPETFDFYKESFNRFKELFLFQTNLVVCDLHPDYLSTKFAQSLNCNIIQVQHHHSHVASAMLENNIDEKVIGISFDGTGLGTDGNIWGGEFFVCDLNDFERIYHFENLPIPGGDIASKQVWRSGISAIYRAFGDDIFKLNNKFLNEFKEKIPLITQAIDKKINSPLSSSAGRLFDAVATIIGLNKISDFHAEAPMRLESITNKYYNSFYEYEIKNSEIKFNKMIQGILFELQNDISLSEISTKFHNTIAQICYDLIIKISENEQIFKVVLSGGTFQNKFLTEKIIYLLKKSNIKIFINRYVPSNDGGIALGQMAIAAKRRELKCV